MLYYQFWNDINSELAVLVIVTVWYIVIVFLCCSWCLFVW